MNTNAASLSKPIYWLLVLFFLVLGAYLFWDMLNTSMYSISSVSKLQDEFLQIQSPKEARRVTAIRTSSKITTQAVYADFLTNLSVLDAISYYKNELVSHGWKKTDERATSKSNYLVKFCKMDMDATIEIITSGSSGTRYYFGIDRYKRSALRTGC